MVETKFTGYFKANHAAIVLIIILGALLLFHFRHKIAQAHDRYRTRRRNGYSTLGGLAGGFSDDLENGLSSNNFDINANIAAGDSRLGLDDQAKQEIQRIMEAESILFDEARLKFSKGKFAKNNIGADGLPKDPKLVTFNE